MRSSLPGLVLSGLLLLPWPAAEAGEIRKLAIVSAIGDTLTIVTHVPETGSHADRNRRDVLQLPDTGFDKLAVASLTEAAGAGVGSVPERVSFIFPSAQDAGQWVQGGRFSPGEPLLADIRGSGASHLLLVSRLRAPAELRTGDSTMGSGYLEGLGFYVDRDSRMRRPRVAGRSLGFLAAYAYLRLTLVDLATAAVVRDQGVRASFAVPTVRNAQAVDPWDALDAGQKVEALQRLIRVDLAKAVPGVLAAP